MLHLNAPFSPLECSVYPKKVTKILELYRGFVSNSNVLTVKRRPAKTNMAAFDSFFLISSLSLHFLLKIIFIFIFSEKIIFRENANKMLE